MKLKSILTGVLLLLLFSCSNNGTNTNKGVAWAPDSFESNGQRIYFTATSDRGDPISYKGGPPMRGMMIGSRLACVSCHGIDARGGKHTMNNEVMDAPDIRWSELSEHHHHEGGEEKENEEEHHEKYDFNAFRNSVEHGRHPDGDKLGKNMPRWKMSDADLRDLMDYLKTK